MLLQTDVAIIPRLVLLQSAPPFSSWEVVPSSACELGTQTLLAWLAQMDWGLGAEVWSVMRHLALWGEVGAVLHLWA